MPQETIAVPLPDFHERKTLLWSSMMLDIISVMGIGIPNRLRDIEWMHSAFSEGLRREEVMEMQVRMKVLIFIARCSGVVAARSGWEGGEGVGAEDRGTEDSRDSVGASRVGETVRVFVASFCGCVALGRGGAAAWA